MLRTGETFLEGSQHAGHIAAQERLGVEPHPAAWSRGLPAANSAGQPLSIGAPGGGLPGASGGGTGVPSTGWVRPQAVVE